MSVKSKMRKMQTSLFPSPESYLSPEQREDFFEELFSESVSTRLRPLTEKERSARTRTSRSDGLVEAVVTRKYEREVWELYRLLFLNVENYDTFEVRVTPEHPFWVLSHGGGKGRYIPVKDLEIGMRCISTSDTPIQLLEKELLKFDEPVKVYNLEVEKAHNYFVGNANGTNVLVHNQCGPMDRPGTSFDDLIGKGTLKNNPSWNLLQNQIAVMPQFGRMLFGTLRSELIAGKITDKCGMVGGKWIEPILAIFDPENETRVGIGAGHHVFHGCGENDPTYVGARAMQPCIGVVIYCPNEKVRAAFHFAQASCNATATLGKYEWPKGARAVIAGGDNSQVSNAQLNEVISALKKNGIKLDGVAPTGGISIDKNGNWVVFEIDLFGEREFNLFHPNHMQNKVPKMIQLPK